MNAAPLAPPPQSNVAATSPSAPGATASSPPNAPYSGGDGRTTAPTARAHRPIRGWHLAVVAVAALLIGLLIGKAGNKSSTSSTAPPTTATAAARPATGASASTTVVAAKQAVYTIGQTAATAGWLVTVYALHDPQPVGDVVEPDAGRHYVSVDVQVTNTAKQAEPWSALVGFQLLDGQNHAYDIQIAAVSPKAPDGSVPAGGSLRGLAVFEVPDGTTGLRLQARASSTASGAIFRLS
jgi:hypothetical protein